MKIRGIAAAILAAAACSPTAHAEDAAGDEANASPWSGEIALGVLAKRGNTRSNSYTGNINAARDGLLWRHTMKVEGTNEEQYNVEKKDYDRSAERYYSSYKLDRRLSENSRNYLFNVASYEKDNFSGFHYSWSYAVGLGRRFIENETHKLEGEIGPGYQQKCVDPESSYRHCDDKEEQGIVRISGKYVWQISEGARFTEEVISEVGKHSASSRAESVLTSKINASFSLRVRHLVKHESKVPAGKKESDHEFSVGLTYTF